MKQKYQLKLIFFSVWFVLTLKCEAQSSADIYQRLLKLREHSTVLYIAAHPDDENTRLITWLSKEKNFRTAYLSLTRGDGGQNLIGPELGVDLGLIRTRELMAARSIDGGEQFFSRAFDFGFSKRPDETLHIWEKEAVLEDIVRVIRTVRPDIIICRFPPDNRAGHGHHSSSAILAAEAFKAAADPQRFPGIPEQGAAWKATRIFWNTFNFGGNNTTSESQLKTDVGGFNAVLGKSYGELAAESRSQHKSQGFGVPAQRGVQIEYFSAVDGDTSITDLFQFDDQYFQSSATGKKLKAAIDNVISSYNFQHPELSVNSLLSLLPMMESWEAPAFFKSRKKAELQQLITDCMGLWTAVYTENESYAINDTIHATVQMIARNFAGVQVHILPTGLFSGDTTIQLTTQELISQRIIFQGIKKTTQPYWLEKEHTKGLFHVTNTSLIGQPWNDAAANVQAEITVNGSVFQITIPAQYKLTDPVRGEIYRPLTIKPAVTVTLHEETAIFTSTTEKKFSLDIIWNSQQKDSVVISCLLKSNPAWKSSFRDTILFFQSKNEEKRLTFTVRPTSLQVADEKLNFTYNSIQRKEQQSLQSVREINYDHIPKITWFPPLSLALKSADIKTTAKRVLYIKGAGDNVAAMIRQLGVITDEIDAPKLEELQLENYDAIITGIRAYNTSPDLPKYFDKIKSYIAAGGIYLVQYNTNNNLHPVQFMAPSPYQISRNRVTEENATVRFLVPDHPLLNTPNKITENDFKGWIQERGLYFATKIDSSYQNILMMHDEGEPDQEGSLIVTKYGKGTYIYTGLSFFRQLPAGVTGAFRLFANLISKE